MASPDRGLRRWSTNDDCRSRLRGRPRAAGACARNGARPDRAAARGLAGAGGRRTAAGGGPESARRSGRAWTRRRSATAGPIRARRSCSSCARPGSRRPAGARRCTCRRFRRGWFLRSAVAWERAGATISAPFAGVHIVEATKQVYRAIPARRERRRLVPALEPALAPSPGREHVGNRFHDPQARPVVQRACVVTALRGRPESGAGRGDAGDGDATGTGRAGRRGRSAIGLLAAARAFSAVRR